MKISRYQYKIKDNNGDNIIYSCSTGRYLNLGQLTLEDLERVGSDNDKENLKKLGFFVESNEEQILKERFYAAKTQNNKFSLIVSLCNNCNFSCTYCYERFEGIYCGDTTRMNEKIEYGLVDWIEKLTLTFNELSICWFGGEPLLEFELIRRLTNKISQICEVNNCKVTYEMVSNGYLLDKEKAKFFSEYNFSSVQITFDGSREKHNLCRVLRNGQGTFDKILYNIEQVSDYIKVVLRINVNKDNIESIKELLQLLKQKVLEKNIYLYFAPIENFGENISESVLSLEDFSKIHVYLVKFAKSLGFNQRTIVDINKCTYCGSNVASSFYVNYKGDLYKCEHLMAQEKDSVGNILSKTQCDTMDKFMAYSPFSYELCVNCKLLPKCWGGCMFKREYIKTDMCPYWKHSYELLITEKFALEGVKND